MSVKLTALVWKLPPSAVTATERLVLLCLGDYESTQGAFAAVRTMARKTSLTPRAVQKALRRLVEKSLIVEDGRMPRGQVRYRLSVSELKNREPGSQSDREPGSQSAANREPGSPPPEPRSPHRERSSPDREPGSPEPFLNRDLEPSENRPALRAGSLSEPDKSTDGNGAKSPAGWRYLTPDEAFEENQRRAREARERRAALEAGRRSA